MLLLIREASIVCVTLDVTRSILWAFILSLARLRLVEEASPGDPGRFLLSSMVLIATGEIPDPLLHCGRCYKLDTYLCPGRSDVFRCPVLPVVSRKFLVLGN